MAPPLPPDLSYHDHPTARRLRRGAWLRIGFILSTIVCAALIALYLEG